MIKLLRTKFNATKGFTLLEAIIYLAIVSIFLTAVVQFHLSLGSTSAKLAAFEEASQNHRQALSTIEYLIKNADGLFNDVLGSCSDMSSTTPLLALYFSNDSYLPATCVSGGGGVKITVDNDTRRLKLTCHPNISNNGQYQACAVAANKTFYLTSPSVAVYKDSWRVNTSTATSSKDGFPAITAFLGVGKASGGRQSAGATSTATSTVVLRNEQPVGLINWYPLETNDVPTAYDKITGLKQTCYWPDYVSGLVSGSTGAYDFIAANGDNCFFSGSGASSAWYDLHAMDGPFTMTAWIKPHFVAGYQEVNFTSMVNVGGRLGYYYETYKDAGCSGRAFARVFDTESSYSNLGISNCGTVEDETVFHMTFVFDPAVNKATQYIYKKSVGGVSTSTTTGIPTLVNYYANGVFRIGNNYAGVLDDVRLYNRALSPSEVWALQSQGAN